MKDNFARKAWISLLIILGSIIVASVVLYYFSNDIAFQASKIASERKAVNGQNSALGSLASLKSDAPKADAYAVAINQLLPDQYGIVNFSSWLDAIAKKYNVTVTLSLSGSGVPSAQPTPSSPGTVDFSFTASGSTGNVTQFLKDAEMESSGFLFNLGSFDYTTEASSEKVNAQGTLFFK